MDPYPTGRIRARHLVLAQVYPREVTFNIGETSLFVEASQEEEMALTVGRNLLSGSCRDRISNGRGS
jgi:hypothetical protein